MSPAALTVADVRTQLADYEVLGFTAYGEAANQPVEGQLAVMFTAQNRFKAKKIGDVADYCLAPMQYSCWNPDTSVNHARLIGAVQTYLRNEHNPGGYPILTQLIYLADGIVKDALLDNTQGATHYLTRTLFQVSPPHWAAGKLPVCAYGDHLFFNRIPF